MFERKVEQITQQGKILMGQVILPCPANSNDHCAIKQQKMSWKLILCYISDIPYPVLFLSLNAPEWRSGTSFSTDFRSSNPMSDENWTKLWNLL
jgi:hypothetical protein